MMLKSLESRFVILPISDDLITYEVVFDIFAYSSIAIAPFIWDAIMYVTTHPDCFIS